jgi:hypothetical protein
LLRQSIDLRRQSIDMRRQSIGMRRQSIDLRRQSIDLRRQTIGADGSRIGALRLSDLTRPQAIDARRPQSTSVRQGASVNRFSHRRTVSERISAVPRQLSNTRRPMRVASRPFRPGADRSQPSPG